MQRFGFVYVPHGSIMREWTPAQEGSNFEFSPILKESGKTDYRFSSLVLGIVRSPAFQRRRSES
jgi:hypothetical protein